MLNFLSSKERREEKKKLKEQKKRQKQGFIGHTIGGPTDFSHDTHVGWDQARGFEVRNIPPEWKKLFEASGVTDEELKDPETRKILIDTVRASMYTGAPVAPVAPAAPPPPPAPTPPPPPPGSGAFGGRSLPTPPSAPAVVDPLAIGSEVHAIWSGDGAYYLARIDGIREQDGVKLYFVNFVEYGETEEITEDCIDAPQPAAPVAPAAPPSFADMIASGTNALKPPDLSNISANQEQDIVHSVTAALNARRAGMCFSVYGHDAVTSDDEWSDDDEDWMDNF